MLLDGFSLQRNYKNNNTVLMKHKYITTVKAKPVDLGTAWVCTAQSTYVRTFWIETYFSFL